MNDDGSITRWIQDLHAGDEQDAQQQLFQRYFQRLVALARVRLKHAPRRMEDEEDVAVNALNSYFAGVRKDRFPLVSDRTSLWPLLAKITACKAINQRNRQLTQKRGGGKVRGESVFSSPDESEGRALDFADHDPTPALSVEMSEQCKQLMDALEDDLLKDIASQKLEGYTNTEIADKLGVVERTVERKLKRIRSIWAEEADK